MTPDNLQKKSLEILAKYDVKAEPLYIDAIQKISEEISRLDEGLITHILNVAKLAAHYAAENGTSIQKAIMAGLSHDMFRTSSKDKIFQYAKTADFQLTELFLRNPMLAHGPAAAGWLRLNIPHLDTHVFEAVRDHTFPDESSNIMTKILASADALEPSRAIDSRDKIRQAAMPFEERYIAVLKIKRGH